MIRGPPRRQGRGDNHLMQQEGQLAMGRNSSGGRAGHTAACRLKMRKCRLLELCSLRDLAVNRMRQRQRQDQGMGFNTRKPGQFTL